MGTFGIKFRGESLLRPYVWFVFTGLFLINIITYCQYRDLKFAHLTTADGLSNSEIFSFAQDQKGFIWIGTADGLNKYNGFSFKVYKHIDEDSLSLIENTINCLFLDSQNRLWIGTGGGISCYNRDNDSFINYVLENDVARQDVSLNRVKTIKEDNKSNIYVANEKGRLYKLDEKVNSFIRISAVQIPLIRTMDFDDNNNIWLGTYDGLIFFDTKTNQFVPYNQKGKTKFYVDKFIEVVFSDKNKLWIGTSGNGIQVIDLSNGLVSQYYPKGEGDTRVNTIYKDRSGNIWIGDAEGLKLLDVKTNKFWSYNYNQNDRHSLVSAGVRSIFEDNQGNLWVATSFGGANIAYVQKSFLHLRNNAELPISLSRNIVSSIHESSDGNLWVGFFNGGIDVINFKTRSTTHFENKPSDRYSISPSTIQTIYEDKNENIWIGTFRGSLQRFDKKLNSFTTYINTTLFPELPFVDIRSIAEDKSGYFWLITHGTGAVKFKPSTGEFNHFISTDEGKPYCFPDNWAFMFLIDSENILWAATPSGLARISSSGVTEKLFQYVPNDVNSLSNNMVTCMAEDSRKNLWVGTADGLNLFNKNKGKFFRITKKNGLSNSAIKAILVDDANNLWISTNKGISRIMLMETSDSIRFNIKNFDVRDGLQDDEFFERSAYKSKLTGQLFFGGNNGITAFHPDSIKNNPQIPPVVFTDFKLFYQSVAIGTDNSPLKKHINETDSIELLYDQNVITFEFAALNYIIPEKNHYAYIMEGFDKSWNYVETEHRATYTNLDPGHYVFRVRAANNDGVWNENGKSVHIYINPPFWITDSAITIYVLIVIIGLYFSYRLIVGKEKTRSQIALERFQAKKMHEMDLMKFHFFTNISHELRTPITLILGPLQNLMKSEKADPEILNYYSLMYRNAQRLLRMVNQLLDFRKLEAGHMRLEATYDDIVKFIKGIAGAFNYNAIQRNITYEVNSSVHSLNAWFDPDKLDKVLYNLISNAFKYTPDNAKIEIVISTKAMPHQDGSQQYIEITVRDTGIGIPKKYLGEIFTLFYQVEGNKRLRNDGSGIGLTLAKEMIELHNGKITVDSSLGEGTCFTVLLPLGSDHLKPGEKVERSINLDEKIAAIELAPTMVAPADDDQFANEKVQIILVIEDDEDIRKYLKSILRETYNVVEAIDGVQGIQVAKVEIPDLILCDIMMDGMSGYEVCKKLKLEERTCHIPIVLLTAASSEESKIEGYETGADDYITKPFNPDLLVARVRNLIHSRKKLKELSGKSSKQELHEAKLNNTDKQFIDKANKIVEAHISDTDFDAGKFATMIGMSRAQLYRKFGAISNQSVADFIKNIRIKRAADMLLYEGKTVAETAYATGFSEPSNFTRSFVKHFGMTPTQYLITHKMSTDKTIVE